MDLSLLNQRLTLNKPLQWILGGCLFIFLVGLLAVGIHFVMAGDTVGMDLHTFYLAAQNVFIKHTSPYGEDVAVQSQLSVLRHLATEQDDRMAFAYPPYSLLVLAPLANLTFDWAQAVWTAFVLLGSVCAMLLAFPRRPLLPALGVLLFYPFTFGIILGNFVNLIGIILLVVISQVFLVKRITTGNQIGLGILLAWATIKPQFVWLFLLVLLLAGLKQRYWPLLVSFAASLAAFFAVSFLLVPNWPSLWLERIQAYAQYVSSVPGVTFFLHQLRSPADSRMLTVALLALLLGVTAWAVFSWWKERLSPLVLLAWIGLVTYLVQPHTVAYTQIAFLIPLLVWAQEQKGRFNIPVILFYWLILFLSWTVFILGKQGTLGALADDWTLVAGCAWMFWLLVWPPAGQFQPAVNSKPV